MGRRSRRHWPVRGGPGGGLRRLAASGRVRQRNDPRLRLRRRAADGAVPRREPQAVDPRCDLAPGRAGQAVEGIPADLHQRRAHQSWCRLLEQACRRPGAGREGIRRAGRDHRLDHRRGNLLRPQHRQLPGDGRAVHPRLRLPAAGRLLPQGVARVPPARPRTAGRPAQPDRLLRRRHGPAAIHAEQLPRLRGGLRRRWPHQYLERPDRRHR
ncbi:Uncharacterised protein [Klebsiella pneumoniae]|nr:Uncharacterised protein [Klebsiella pneumoniae]